MINYEEINLAKINNLCKVEEIANKVIEDLEEYSKSIWEVKDMPNFLPYYLKMKGKRTRLIKMILAARITGGITKDIFKVMTALEFANSAIFLHDDIIDHDIERKGKPTMNGLIGYEKAILVGNILHALTFNEISQIKNDQLRNTVLSEFSRALYLEHVGQYMDLDLRWNFKGDLKKWETMVLRHSGFYVMAALKSIAILNNADKKIVNAFEKYEENCALAGAAEDAILGFNGKKNKGDLKNGTFTILVNFALNGDHYNIPHTGNELEKRINLTLAIEEAQEYVKDKVSKAIDALAPIPNCEEKKALIFLANQIAEVAK
jgi:geranylgeranyl diphosphate synthase type I